jgi:hypothetical protein
MTLSLDLRAPVFVLIADFNPAIFQLPWIAKHLLERDEGEVVPLVELVTESNGIDMSLLFLDGVALNVQLGRTEILAVNTEADTLSKAESMLLKVLAVLPHTPLRAIGCNLNYRDPNPPDRLTELFDTPEQIEAEYPVIARQVSAQLTLEENCVLNFGRALSQDQVRFSFNYHRTENNIGKYEEFVPGILERRIQHSADLLKRCYGYDDFDRIGFLSTEELGREIDDEIAA